MSFKLNPLLMADSYKYGHINMYPNGVTEVYSNFTPRSVKHLTVPEKYKTNEIVWFGGQAVIKDMVEMWNENFFNIGRYDVTNPHAIDNVIDEFSKLISPFAGANYKVDHLHELYKLGYLPLEIKTLPEGSRIPVGVPVLTVRNTKPEFYWLTNFIETYLSAELWKMSTSATIADYYRKIMEYWAEKTGGNSAFIDFQCHDFSYRGMSGSMDAIKSGAGHLVSFKGTDTVPSVDYINYHYDGKETFIGASVPATEHSIQTSFVENDLEYFKSMINKYPKGIVSIVADGYDYWSVLTNVLPQLKNDIMNRQPDAMGFNKVVIRPDSGDPVSIICGNEYYTPEVDTYEEAVKHAEEFFIDNLREETPHGEYGGDIDDFFMFDGELYSIKIEVFWNRYDKQYYFIGAPRKPVIVKIEDVTAEMKGSIQVLWELFGGTVNDKGYKTLDQHIGLIYGDSITLDRAEEILKRLEAKGFASDNVVFGVGSYTYQGGGA